MSDRGAASVALLGVVAVTAVLGIGVGAVGQFVAARTAVQTAADAAALAAAPVTFRPYGAPGSPAAEAARFAVANGARLVSCRCPLDRSLAPRDIVVRVERTVGLLGIGRFVVTARAGARFDPRAVF